MLERRLKLLQAVSLNMSMMVGIGPFIAVPLLLSKVTGPLVLIAWVIGAAVAVADGLVWSELAAAFPGSGGTYHFFDAIHGRRVLGRALKFLFVWQFLFSGPLELASGMLGFAEYAGYLWPSLSKVIWQVNLASPGRVRPLSWVVTGKNLVAMVATASLVGLAYRRIESAGRLMVGLWLGMLVTVTWLILEGAFRFDPSIAFAEPEGGWSAGLPSFSGMGAALGVTMYCYLGYYQVCYLGDEVAHPSRTIPRSIAISVVGVGAIYFGMSLAILGVIPWREAAGSGSIASDFIGRLRGTAAAQVLSLMVMWSAAAGCFAALLGYSRIPYAAARSGHFFRGLARTHPTGDFPHLSLLLLGGLATVACLGDLGSVIDALLSSRILIQFVAQILTVFYLRSQPELMAGMPFRMVGYPIPAMVALVGWFWVFGTTSTVSIAYGLASLVAGILAFAIWDRKTDRPD